MTDHERIERELHEAAAEVRVGTAISSEVRRRIRARRFSTVAVASLVTISVIAAGTLAARSLSNSPLPPAGGDLYSADVPAEVWVVGEDGLAAPALNLAWDRDSETGQTLACVGSLPRETSRVELVHDGSGDVLSWGGNFVARDDSVAVCAYNLEAEVLVRIANNPTEYRLIIDRELEVRLLRTESVPTSEPTVAKCEPGAIGFEPGYLPRGWVPELQEGAALGKDPFGNIIGHYSADGPPGGHKKIDAGFVDLVASGFRFPPPRDIEPASESDLVVLGEPAEFDEENGAIEFGFDGCAYALVGAGVGREELVPFAEGLRPKAEGEGEQQSDENFAAIWPEDTYERASEACTSAAHKADSWRRDPERTALRFGALVLGWDEPVLTESEEKYNQRYVYELRPQSSSRAGVIVFPVLIDEGWCWSIGSVSRLPKDQPEDDGSMSVRGRDVSMGFDLQGASSATFEVGYGGQITRYEWTGGDTGVEFTLDFEPRGTGHFLVLLRDENGEVFSAFGSPLPTGDFAAG